MRKITLIIAAVVLMVAPAFVESSRIIKKKPYVRTQPPILSREVPPIKLMPRVRPLIKPRHRCLVSWAEVSTRVDGAKIDPLKEIRFYRVFVDHIETPHPDRLLFRCDYLTPSGCHSITVGAVEFNGQQGRYTTIWIPKGCR